MGNIEAQGLYHGSVKTVGKGTLTTSVDCAVAVFVWMPVRIWHFSRKTLPGCFLPHIITSREARANPVSRLLHLNPTPRQSKSKARCPAVQTLYLGLEFGGSCAESLTSRQNNLSAIPAGTLHNSPQLFPDKVLRVEEIVGRNSHNVSSAALFSTLNTLSTETHLPSSLFFLHFQINVHLHISPPLNRTF